jgi:hypothetical protein
MIGFIVGAAAGVIAMYLWREQITEYLDSSTQGMRTRAADSLKQAGSALESASGKITETLEAGEGALRPGPSRMRDASINR